MTEIVTRNTKGSKLSIAEGDNQIANLVRNVTSNTNLTSANNREIIVANGNSLTINLENSAVLEPALDSISGGLNVGYVVTITNIHATAVTVGRVNALDTVNGAASDITLVQYESISVFYDTSNNVYFSVFNNNFLAYLTDANVFLFDQTIRPASGNASLTIDDTGADNNTSVSLTTDAGLNHALLLQNVNDGGDYGHIIKYDSGGTAGPYLRLEDTGSATLVTTNNSNIDLNPHGTGGVITTKSASNPYIRINETTGNLSSVLQFTINNNFLLGGGQLANINSADPGYMLLERFQDSGATAGYIRIYEDGEIVALTTQSGNINLNPDGTGKILYNGTEVSKIDHTHTGVYEPANANIQSHIASTADPHNVTATQVGLGNVTNESKATMFASPTFTGTVSGVTATHVGLGNVTNESKATMFSSPTFTGTVAGVTATHVGLGNVTNESKATMFASPTFTGTVSGVTKGHVGLGNCDNTSDVNKPVSTATQAAIDAVAGGAVAETAIATTSGTSVEWTGLADAQVIYITLDDIKYGTPTTDGLQIQIGNTTVETSAYVGFGVNTGGGANTHSSAFNLAGTLDGVSDGWRGYLAILTRLTGDTWILNGHGINVLASIQMQSSGRKTIAGGELTNVKLLTAAGATFSAGQAGLTYIKTA